MERRANSVTAGRVNVVHNVDSAMLTIQLDAPTVLRRWFKYLVAVVFGRPVLNGLIFVELHRHSVCHGMADPQERAGREGLVLRSELDGVVAQCRSEVAPPLGLAVVAVSTRIGQDVDSSVANFDRECIRVGVGREREVTVRTRVAATPDLGLVIRLGSKQRQTGIGEVRGSLADRKSTRLNSSHLG